MPPLLTDLRRPPLRVWVWTAATLALVVVAALLWRGSDAAATESTTAAPADVPSGTPAGAVSEAWTAAGGPLPESVVEGGRVLVGSPIGVRALDPATGKEAWHYTRANARLCGLTATNGVAVAVFRTEDRCDEAVALDAGTGVRAWTRSVDFREDATLDSTDQIVLAGTPTGVVTLDPTGNNIRWRYAPPGTCELLGAEVGSAGVAVLQHCDGAAVVRLRLFDGFDGDPHWTRRPARPRRRGDPAARRRRADRPPGRRRVPGPLARRRHGPHPDPRPRRRRRPAGDGGHRDAGPGGRHAVGPRRRVRPPAVVGPGARAPLGPLTSRTRPVR